MKDVPRSPGPRGDKVQRGRLREPALQDLGSGEEAIVREARRVLAELGKRVGLA